MTASNLHTCYMFSGIKFVQIDGFMITINACFYLNGNYHISLAVRHWLGDDLKFSNLFSLGFANFKFV